MARLVEFDRHDGVPVLVNPDQVRFVVTSANGNGIFIAFDEDRGVTVQGSLEWVRDNLNGDLK